MRSVSTKSPRLSIRFIRWSLAAAAAAAVGVPVLAAPPDPAEQPSNAELIKQVQALRDEVRELKANQAAEKKGFDSRVVDATVAAVLADADRHTLNFSPGGKSGHDLEKGFFIKSDDGNFSLYPDLLFQFRGVAAHREKSKNGDSETNDGFEIRRAKFGFYGTAFDPDLSFRFLWQDTNNNSSVALQYAWGQYVFAHNVLWGGDLAARAGQFKNVVFKEETTPDRTQLFAERSLANFLIGGSAIGPETQGVDLLLTGNGSPLHLDLLLHDGIKRNNTSFNDVQPITVTNPTTGVVTTTNVATNFGVAGRADYKLFGRWGDGDDFTGVWGREDLLIAGGGVDFTQGDHQNVFHFTADVQYQLLKKLSLFAGVYGTYYDFRNQTGPTNRNDWGGQIEAGYFITPAIQPIVRYSITKFDSKFKTGGTDTFHEIAGGVNYFFGKEGQLGNRAKFTLDLTYLPNGTPAFSGGDFLASPSKKEELVLRGQFQLSL
jgi:hypothetical protein